MSAYIVDNKVLNTVLVAIVGDSRLKLCRCETFACESFLYEERDEVVNDAATRIGVKLLAMNYDAVNQRYRLEDEPHEFKYQRIHAINARFVYAAIKELIYQCCEGNVPETNPLYEELKALKASVAVQIMDDMVRW